MDFKLKSQRSTGSFKLLSWGFRNTDTFEVSRRMKQFSSEVMAWERSRNSRNNKRRYFNLKEKRRKKLKVLLKYKGPIKAPVEKDSEIASIEIYVKDELIKKTKVYAAKKVEKVNVFKKFIYVNKLLNLG